MGAAGVDPAAQPWYNGARCPPRTRKDPMNPVKQRILDGDDKCDECGKHIPVGRLEAIPDTRYCVNHSKTAAYVGVMSYGHKTAGEVAYVKGDDEEAVRLLWRAYRRSR